MASATGYTLSTPMHPTVGLVSPVTVTLTGGLDLTQDIVVTLTGDGTMTFADPVTISSGTLSGTSSFILGGPNGTRTISSTYTGGNGGMAHSNISFRAEAPATGYSFSVSSVSSSYQGRWVNQSNPLLSSGFFQSSTHQSGVGFLITAWLTGGWALPSPMAINFSDDTNNGIFLGNPLNLSSSQTLDNGGRGISDCLYYIPRKSGTRIISANYSGGDPSFTNPSPVSLNVNFDSPPVGFARSEQSIPLPTSPPVHYINLPTAIYPAATSYSISVISPPSSYQSTTTTGCRSGPTGVAQFLQIRLIGGTALTSPLVVTLSDDASGLFPDGPITINGGDSGQSFAITSYVPTVAGLRTISASHSGGNVGMSNPTAVTGAFLAI